MMAHVLDEVILSAAENLPRDWDVVIVAVPKGQSLGYLAALGGTRICPERIFDLLVAASDEVVRRNPSGCNCHPRCRPSPG